MTLQFIDSFDHYTTAQLTRKWSNAVGAGTNIAITNGAGRFGGNALRVLIGTPSADFRHVDKNLPLGASWVFGAAVYLSRLGSVWTTLFHLYDGTSPQAELRVDEVGKLHVTRNGAGVTGGHNSALSLSLNTWYYIEWKITIANSIPAGSCQVRVNSVEWINVAAGQDLQNTAAASITQFRLGKSDNTSYTVTLDCYYDDLYICDQSGVVNNSFLGDVRVECLYPTGAGNKTQWVPSTGVNWDCVNDPQASDDADYVSTSMVEAIDTYVLGDLSAPSTGIPGIQTCLLTRKNNAGSRTVAPVLRSQDSDFAMGNTAVLDSYAYDLRVVESNPAGGVWNDNAISALEVGVKLVA